MTTHPSTLSGWIAQAITTERTPTAITTDKWAHRYAAAILPLVQAEVRKAKAEAWDECEATAIIEDAPCHEDFLFMVTHAPNPYSETGGSDEQ